MTTSTVRARNTFGSSVRRGVSQKGVSATHWAARFMSPLLSNNRRCGRRAGSRRQQPPAASPERDGRRILARKHALPVVQLERSVAAIVSRHSTLRPKLAFRFAGVVWCWCGCCLP